MINTMEISTIKEIGVIEFLESEIAFKRDCIKTHKASIETGEAIEVHKNCIRSIESEIRDLKDKLDIRIETLKVFNDYDYNSKSFVGGVELAN